MLYELWSVLRAFLGHGAGRLSHLVIVGVSAGIALLLPAGVRQFLSLWSLLEHDKVSLVAVEMILAILLMVCFNYVHRHVRDRSLATAATGAGLVSFFPRPAPEAQRRITCVKKEQGTGRTVMVIGSSGSGSLMDQVGDLSSVLDTCLEAKVFLANPFSQDAQARMGAFGRPADALPAFREEVRQSIALLKRLRAMGKVVKLKLYADPPLVKLVILGDYIWLQHHHAELDGRYMPEYLLQRNGQTHGFYSFYAHYFMERWEHCDCPEYDLDTDELVYRSRAGREIRREPVEISAAQSRPAVDATPPRHGHDAFQLRHAPGPYLPVRGYGLD